MIQPINIITCLILATAIAMAGESTPQKSSPNEQKKSHARLILDFSQASSCQSDRSTATPTKRANLRFTDKGMEVEISTGASCDIPGKGVLKLETRAQPQQVRLVTIIKPGEDEGC